jgi:hypothetical protein
VETALVDVIAVERHQGAAAHLAREAKAFEVARTPQILVLHHAEHVPVQALSH